MGRSNERVELKTCDLVGLLGRFMSQARPSGCASARSRQLSTSGLAGRGVEAAVGQAAWNRSTRRTADLGGARAGKCRWVRILVITAGSTIAAMIFKRPPQFAQCSKSISNTRLSRQAQLMRAGEARDLGVVIASLIGVERCARNDLGP